MALRRITVARDIANTVLFLVSDESANMTTVLFRVSDESANMTGQSVTVDGGWDV